MDFPGKSTIVRSVQDHLGLIADGKDGPLTWGAIKRVVGTAAGSSSNVMSLAPSIPADNVRSIRNSYGQEGDESNLVWFKFPYPMWLYNRQQKLTRHRCHRDCKEELEGILETARDELGLDFIQKFDLDTFYGCFNHRPMRGRSRGISRHSWGIAIDFAAHRNGFRTPWPSKADMPVDFIKIFERFGWKSGARAWGKDAMHFQRTK